ncbi:hypothetical protein JCM10512_3262 [Bacteroides reticulotermitis JCM 10512]|uniref:Uncharacterized protein n=2 Tax=Bacteroides reticulotermitis TaxID=1133319 RepID=W4UVB1_9BACE|nr:hypothetical protein JCM10512_3262 [Bacteroides reticulotermitis JCM 10512]
MIEYTSRSGEYYGKAHLQRIYDDHMEICLNPHVPFCYEMDKSPCYDTSGGSWLCPEKVVLEPAGTGSREFKTWGHAGRCAHGAVHFCTSVRKWRYTEPAPFYGKYTGKDWARYFISKRPEPERPGEFTYKCDEFTLYSETEFNRLVKSCTEKSLTVSTGTHSSFGDTVWTGNSSRKKNGKGQKPMYICPFWVFLP